MIMKKNGFLTFICACIPGAGQMYYGYMKRGVSLISYFCLFTGLGVIFGPIMILDIVVYMFSFFDTYDLIRYLAAGDPKPDEFLIPTDWKKKMSQLEHMPPKMNRMVGWGLLLVGAYVLYQNVLWPIVSSVLERLGVYWSTIYQINEAIPSIVVAVILIGYGCRLLGVGKYAAKDAHKDTDDLPPYQGQ